MISAFTVSETLDLQPTATSTPFPAPSTPFEQPTATPESSGDLQPYFGSGQPVRVRNPNGGPFVEKSDLLVDFFVVNAGSATVTGDYYIDLYIDDNFAQRYPGINIAPNNFIFIEGGTGLLDLFPLQPGEHEVKLVIDPTNLIAELSDGDNTYAQSFTWDGSAIPTPSPGDRLPNLSLVGGSTGIIAAPFAGAATSGGLSTKGETFLSFQVLNDSPISIDNSFGLNVMFDDVMVNHARYSGLLGGEYIMHDWQELASQIRITPGEHTIKLIADPSGAITESDESDNSVELTLTWGTNEPTPAPTPELSRGAPIREVQVFPNLTGFRPHGWDAAISASSTADALSHGRDGNVFASTDTVISIAIRNSSRVNSAASVAFDTQIFVDGQLLETIRLISGNDAGSYWTESVTIPAGDLEPGQHMVSMVVDSLNDVFETSEDDNSLARWFEFLPGTPEIATDPEVFVIGDTELQSLLDPLTTTAFTDQVRATTGSGFDLPDWSVDIENAGRAGYYLVTGRDLDEERIVMHLLPHDQFIAASFNACMTDYFLLSDLTYIANYDACIRDRGEIGFKSRLNGKIHVYVDLAESPITALVAYFHELGHALQDIENPVQTDANITLILRGLFEAEAQIFGAAALRAIESYMGIDLMRAPDNTVTRNLAEFILGNSKALSGSAEHVLGHMLLWHEVLADTSMLNLDDELRANKRLSGASAKLLFDYLVSLDPADLPAWQSIVFSDSGRADEFVAISLSRLESGLDAASWGHPTLREPTFLVP
jgi:hypothetical protein